MANPTNSAKEYRFFRRAMELSLSKHFHKAKDFTGWYLLENEIEDWILRTYNQFQLICLADREQLERELRERMARRAALSNKFGETSKTLDNCSHGRIQEAGSEAHQTAS